MSNIRKTGINYLHNALGHEPSGAVTVSKYYKADESWTHKPTWWFDLPIKKITDGKIGYYYLLGKENTSGFVILKVPTKFLRDNLEKFDTRYQGRIRLHLTAQGKNRLVDDRVNGQVNFSCFEQAYQSEDSNRKRN